MLTLQDAAQQASIQFAGKEAQAGALQEQAAAAATKAEVAFDRVRELELALATAQATLASQREITSELRAHLATRDHKTPGKPGARAE